MDMHEEEIDEIATVIWPSTPPIHVSMHISAPVSVKQEQELNIITEYLSITDAPFALFTYGKQRMPQLLLEFIFKATAEDDLELK